jgi:hypothetical protein
MASAGQSLCCNAVAGSVSGCRVVCFPGVAIWGKGVLQGTKHLMFGPGT